MNIEQTRVGKRIQIELFEIDLHHTLAAFVLYAVAFDLVQVAILHVPEVEDVGVDQHVVHAFLQWFFHLYVLPMKLLIGLLKDSAYVVAVDIRIYYVCVVHFAGVLFGVHVSSCHASILHALAEPHILLPLVYPRHAHHIPLTAHLNALRHLFYHVLYHVPFLAALHFLKAFHFNFFCGLSTCICILHSSQKVFESTPCLIQCTLAHATCLVLDL